MARSPQDTQERDAMSSERAGNEVRSEPAAAGFADRFAETSFKGTVTRAALAWVLITPVVVAAKIWLSPAAAVVVCLVAVTVYCVVAVRFRRRHRQPSVS
jgi:Flp pilus assembly protein TadB